MLFRGGVLLLALLLLLGCRAGNPYHPVPKELGVTLDVFEDVVRWRDLRKIYGFTKPDAAWEVQPRLDNVRVTAYETSLPAEIEPWRWGQNVVISYVLEDRQVVKQLVEQLVWASEDEGKRWYLVSPPPVF